MSGRSFVCERYGARIAIGIQPTPPDVTVFPVFFRHVRDPDDVAPEKWQTSRGEIENGGTGPLSRVLLRFRSGRERVGVFKFQREQLRATGLQPWENQNSDSK